MDVGALTLGIPNTSSCSKSPGPAGLAIRRARDLTTQERSPGARPARRVKHGPNRQVHLREPRATGKRRCPAITQTRGVWVRALLDRAGALWARVCRSVIVSGYSVRSRRGRTRALRKDGAQSIAVLLSYLMECSDLRTGWVGARRRGKWVRLKQRDLAQFAFGSQLAADLKRVQRAVRALVSMGLVNVTQVRSRREDGSFYSEAAELRLNWDRLCGMAGTSGQLKRDRKHADDQGKEIPEVIPARRHAAPTQRTLGASVSNHYSTKYNRGDPRRAGASPSSPTSLFELLMPAVAG